MNKALLLIIFSFVLSYSLTAQPGFRSVYFEDALGAEFHDVVIKNDTVVLYGFGRDSITGIQGFRFVKLDTFGNILSEKLHIDTTIILSTQLWRQGLIQTQDGGYAIAGAVFGGTALFLLKVHADLSLDFIKMYPKLNVWQANSTLLEIASGGYMVVGEQTFNGNRDIIVVKTDVDGNQIWRKTYGEVELQEVVLGISEFSPNKFVLTGDLSNYTSSQATYGKCLILEIDSVGNEIERWESGVEFAAIRGYQILPDSSWICASGTWEYAAQYGSYMSQPVIFRMDKHRNVMWEKKLGRLYKDNRVKNIIATSDGHFLATGYLTSTGSVKAIHYKFKANGDSLWMRLDSAYVDNGGLTYPETHVIGSAQLSSGSIVSVGYSRRATPLGVSHVGFVMKMSPDGCVDTLDCWVVPNTEPFVQSKLQVYPNPFVDRLTIDLQGYIPQKAYIYIYDIMGRLLQKERVQHGRNELIVKGFERGMVLYEVRDGAQVLGRGKLVKVLEN